jgi:hypothetical protein
MVLHIHKATSVHKKQGIACGKGKPDELVRVGLGGEGISPGLDLVAFLWATEISTMAIYDDIFITREQLFKIGKVKGYEKQGFESKLGDIQAKPVPPMIALITSQQDTFKDKHLSGSCQRS